MRNGNSDAPKDYLCSLLMSHDCSAALRENKEFLCTIIPELEKTIGFEQNNPYHIYDVFEHTLLVLDSSERELNIRLAAFFHDIGKPACYTEDSNGRGHFKGHGRVSADMAEEIMKRLGFEPKIIDIVCQLIYYHDATFVAGKKYARRWLEKIGEEQFRRLLKLRKADICGHTPGVIISESAKITELEALLDVVIWEGERISPGILNISGKELIGMGVRPGKEIGDILRLLLELVEQHKVANEREALMEAVKRYWS